MERDLCGPGNGDRDRRSCVCLLRGPHGHRHPGGYPWAGRNYRSGWRGKPWRGRHYGPLLDRNYFDLGNSIFGRHVPPAIRGNKRLRGTQQYLRMRRALQDSSHYRIQDPIPSWESQHK